MAAIDLSGFVTYTPGPTAITGGSVDATSSELVLGSIPIIEKLQYPQNGIYMSYGRDIVQAQNEARANAAMIDGARLKTVSLRLEIGNIYTKFVSEDVLKAEGTDAIKFFNFSRTTTSLQDLIFAEFNDYSRRTYGGSIDISRIEDSIVGISQRPELWEPLLEEHPLFQKISAVIIPISEPGTFQTPPGKNMRYIGYVHPRAAGSLLSVEMGIDSSKLRLPSWLTRVPVTAFVTRDDKGFEAVVVNSSDNSQSTLKAKDLNKLAFELYRRGIDVASKASGLDATASAELEVLLQKLGS